MLSPTSLNVLKHDILPRTAVGEGILAVPSGLSLSVSSSSGGGAMCGGDGEAGGNISGDLGGEGILVVFSETSVNGEAHGVDGDVSD